MPRQKTSPKRDPQQPQAYKVGRQPTRLDFEKSLMFFHAYMYGPLQGKLRLYSARGVSAKGGVMSSDWEVFASILVGDLGTKLHAGIDLKEYEVKSAGPRASYEYQYHKLTGTDKLAADMQVGHLFFEYAGNLKRVDLRYAHGSWMADFFSKWLAEYPNPYPQRYRKNVSYGWVESNGILLMTFTEGEVTFPRIVAEPSDSIPKSVEASGEDTE